MVWETEIYHHIEVKDGFPALECLTVDTIDISEWLEFEFYDLICFWNNHPKDTKPILGQSHRVGSELCYWIISEKGKVLSHTTVQHLTADKPRYPKFQEQIHDYHGSLETALWSDYIGTNLDGYDSFINYYEEGNIKGEPNNKEYQGLQDSPDIYDIIDSSYWERSANSYDQYLGDQAVLPDRKGDKLKVKVRKHIKYDDISTVGGRYMKLIIMIEQ